jgi:hypothetical protein
MANPLLEPVAAAISTALPLLKKNNGEFEGVTAIFYDANNSTKTVVRAFDNNEEQTLFEPVKILSTNKTISSKYSDEFIRKTVIDHYHDLLLKKKNIIMRRDCSLFLRLKQRNTPLSLRLRT